MNKIRVDDSLWWEHAHWNQLTHLLCLFLQIQVSNEWTAQTATQMFWSPRLFALHYGDHFKKKYESFMSNFSHCSFILVRNFFGFDRTLLLKEKELCFCINPGVHHQNDIEHMVTGCQMYTNISLKVWSYCCCFLFEPFEFIFTFCFIPGQLPMILLLNIETKKFSNVIGKEMIQKYRILYVKYYRAKLSRIWVVRE